MQSKIRSEASKNQVNMISHSLLTSLSLSVCLPLSLSISNLSVHKTHIPIACSPCFLIHFVTKKIWCFLGHIHQWHPTLFDTRTHAHIEHPSLHTHIHTMPVTQWTLPLTVRFLCKWSYLLYVQRNYSKSNTSNNCRSKLTSSSSITTPTRHDRDQSVNKKQKNCINPNCFNESSHRFSITFFFRFPNVAQYCSKRYLCTRFQFLCNHHCQQSSIFIPPWCVSNTLDFITSICEIENRHFQQRQLTKIISSLHLSDTYAMPSD